MEKNNTHHHWQNIVAQSLSGQAWLAIKQNKDKIKTISEQSAVSLSLAEMMAGFYNIDEHMVESFLNPKIKNLMTDPNVLKDMAKGSDAMLSAINEKKTIALFGDYDVDGAASIALLHRYLTQLGCKVIFHVPDRLYDGYGPNQKAIDDLIKSGAELLVFLDCGTSALNMLTATAQKKIPIIIIDHHLSEPIPALPDDLSLINPNRFDEKNDYGYLCAAGVAFLFLVILQKKLRHSGRTHLPDLMTYLDLVALATVGDVVPLIHLNRAFVKQGLYIINRKQNIGLTALCDILSINHNLTSGRLAFYICPSINAGGRLGFSQLGATLLTTQDKNTANQIALQLYQYNEERKIIEQDMLALADDALNTNPSWHKKNIIMIQNPKWHIGILGIIASRLKEKYHRPVIIGGANSMIDEDKKNTRNDSTIITASARSYAGLDIGATIMAAHQAGLLLAGGGHTMAGGFKCEAKNWHAISDFINHHIDKQCRGHLPQSTKKIAATLPLSALTSELAIEIEMLEPFGRGNRTPLIMIKDVVLEKITWLKEQHLSVSFSSRGMAYKKLRAIMFRALNNKTAQHLATSKAGSRFHLIGELYANDWQGYKAVDFFLVDAVVANDSTTSPNHIMPPPA
ncbi:MAG: single-stranded-DNA-specific exonuclease RecJ [Alphaproteobacteria bacterium]